MAKILLVYDEYSELMATETALKKVGFDVIGLSNEFSLGEQVLSFNPEVVVSSGQSARVSAVSIGRKLKENTRWTGKSILIFPSNIKPAAAEILKVRADIFLEAPVPIHSLTTVICELLGQDPGPYIERLVRIQPGDGGNEEGQISSPMSFGKGGAAQTSSRGNDSIFVRGAGDSASDNSRVSDSAEGNLFPDVDLGSLEKELMGSSAVDISGEPPPALSSKGKHDLGTDSSSEALTSLGEVLPESELLAEELEKIRNEVHAASKLSAEKKARYSKAMSEVMITAKSTLSRVETRKRQKDLKAGWSSEKLKDLDELRRQFVKALFKKGSR